MKYWDEVKRIQVSMRAALIYTEEATDIIDAITGKYGYIFSMSSIYQAVPIEEMRRMISELKKRGGDFAAQAEMIETTFNDEEGPFVVGEELTEAEIAANETELLNVVRQLEVEVSDYIKQKSV